MLWTLLACAAAGGAVWLAPEVIVRTNLRDRPLAAAFTGIDGTITSSGAQWGWLGGIEYRDVVLRDRAGRAAVVVPRLLIDRGLLRLALDRDNLGTVRLVEPEASVEVRGDGSSLEDILAAWLAASGQAPAMEIEVVDATIEFVDATRADAWRLTDVIAAGTLDRDGTLAGWTAAGRLRHADAPGAARPPQPATAAPLPAPGAPVRLDRSTIPAAAAAVLVRDGGWSLSSPAAAADGSRTITVAAHRLPLGFSSVLATRFGGTHVVDGVADLRLDVATGPAGRRLQGSMTLEQFALCGAERLDEQFTLERCEVPFDVTVADGRVAIHRFALASPVFRADASGGVQLPRGDLRQWADELVADTFSLAVDVDLAAAARSLPAGIAVRPDVRVTGGTLRFAASARADGDDRLLEVRATARDLAAVQAVAADGAGKPLVWQEPFTAWLKARRGVRGGRLRIEEARVVSKAVEVSAAGTPAAMAIQWTADLGSLATELADVLDLGDVRARGRSRGRIDIADGGPGLSDVKLAATVSDVEIARPSRPVWRDEEITIEAEALAAVTTGVAAVERARLSVTAGDDRLEANLGGGVIVDVASLVGLGGSSAVPWIRPAATADAVAADASLTGELATWQPRLSCLVPWPADLETGGRIKAALAIIPKGDAWLVQRFGAEVEKFTARWAGREIAEPRVVATGAGRLDASTGRIDVSSGEILTATVSLRTGGITWVPRSAAAEPLADGLRGRLQWQADLARLEPWIVPADVVARWPASGRAWGTVEIVDAQAGLNVLVEATGSQLVLATNDAAGRRPAWSEPRMGITVEVTRPFMARGGFADEIRIDKIAVESSTFAFAATGRVDDWSTRRVVSLDGTAAYDWAQVSRLLTPWTGGRLQIVGSGGRPFALRGSLAAPPPLAAATASPAAASTGQTIPLPDDWLAASRGRKPGDGAVAARVTRPASSSPAALDERIRGLAIDTSAAWTAADVDGFQFSAGETAVRLLEGQLAFGPFDLAAAGGRLRAAPWVRLAPLPGELIIPPGRVAERIALTGALADRWMRWFSPVLGHATHASGVATIDLAGARVPLGDPFGGEAAGQVTFENFEVTPAVALQPLATLIVKLQSVIDPRFAFGDKAVLMRVRPEPIRFRLADRKLAHEGLVMDAGQLTVRSAGTVADDGALAMTVEVAFRGDLGGQTPVVGQLLRTPLVIPLRGTVHQPQFDARSIDTILGRIVENTAEAVITDGIGRGLDALFGAPPAAGAPAQR
jgi:translocation and assembly module TamB